MWKFGLASLLLLLSGIHSSVSAQVTIINDNLDLDTSSDYTIVNGGHGPGDGSVEFAFDYGMLGIPSAPGTTDGSTRGVKITVNETANNPGLESEAYTIFHNTEISNVQDYTMTVDVFMGVWSPTPDTGSTEHAHIGVAGDGVTLNQMFQASPFTTSGSGNFVVLSSDGGDSSDYRHWRDNANGGANPGPVNNFDPDYLSTDSGTNVVGDNFLFFEQISNSFAPFPGVIGDAWATVKVEVLQSEGRLKYYVRGASAETTGPPGTNLPPEFIQIIDSPLFDTDGFVSFGLGDLYNSVAVNPDEQFAIFDNLFVEGTPSSGPACDLDSDLDCDLADLALLYDQIDAGTSTNADISQWLADAGTENGLTYFPGDTDLNGSVGGGDFTALASSFGNTGLSGTSTAYWSDGNFDGNAGGAFAVGGSDFTALASNFGASSLTAVPEPSGLALVLLGTFAVFRRRSK